MKHQFPTTLISAEFELNNITEELLNEFKSNPFVYFIVESPYYLLVYFKCDRIISKSKNKKFKQMDFILSILDNLLFIGAYSQKDYPVYWEDMCNISCARELIYLNENPRIISFKESHGRARTNPLPF